MNITHALVILGGGNMGGAMARCWHARGIALTVVERNEARRAAFIAEGITAVADVSAVSLVDATCVLAIKPQQFASLEPSITAALSASHLLISIMAGIPLSALQVITPHAVRVMPNLPALIGESMSGACAPALDATRRAEVTHLLEAQGKIAWVEQEEMLHALTAISGSGPAYLFAFMEAMQQAAITQGLPPELARLLVNQTIRGAALLASASAEDASTLRKRVTSPGGTTEAALTTLQKGGLNSLVQQAVEAAASRSKTLAQ